MSLRTFVDSGGKEWQVFDVVPRTTERRAAERRASRAPARPTIDRRETDRRLTVGNLARLSTISAGWLCFEFGSDCRRLSPIPSDWRRCSDADLERYCESARPVRSWNRDIAHF